MSHFTSQRSILFLTLLVLPSLAMSIEAGGTIDSDINWSVNDSPVHVTETLNILPGAALTIQAGIIVNFESGTGLIVDGRILVNGSKDDSVFFTSTGSMEPGAWGGVILRGGGEPAWDENGDYTEQGSCLKYFVMEYAGDPGFESGSALEITSDAPLISNSTIRFCRGNTGTIRCGNFSRSMIADCHVGRNRAVRGGGISLGIGSSTIIKNSTFVHNHSDDHGGAVYISLANTVELSGNMFLGNSSDANGGAIYAAVATGLSIVNNAFTGNQSRAGSPVLFISERVDASISGNLFDSPGFVIYLYKATNAIDASGNWWGDPREYRFDEAVRDRLDDRSEPTVNYRPPLWAPPENTPVNPTSVDSIILCRNDSYSEELPYGVADGAPLRIRLAGVDSDPFFRDIIRVRVISAQDPDGINVPLTETEPSSSVYIGRGEVASMTDQSRYLIGDQTGGFVKIFAPFAPDVVAEYETMSPNPLAENFAIPGEEDITHVVDHTPIFIWTYFEVVERPQTHYDIMVHEYGTDDDPLGEIIWDSGEVQTESKEARYAGMPLEDGRTYIARLRVYSGYLWSEDWVNLTFRMNSIPTAPMIIAPVAEELVKELKPQLSINISQDLENDALQYAFEIYRADGNAKPVQQTKGIVPAEGKASWRPDNDLTENTGYRFRVRASDPFEDGIWSEYGHFYTNSKEENPAAFSLRSPIGEAEIYLLHPNLEWEEAVDPDPLSSVTYYVEIGKNPDFSDAVIYKGIAETYFTVPDSLDNQSDYHWRVIAVDNTGLETTSSNTGSFHIDTTPSIPQVSAPLNGEERLPTATLTWQASTDPNPNDLIDYEIEVHETSAFQGAVASITGWTETSLPVNRLNGWESLTDNQVYFWRMRSHDNHNARSSYSALGSFFFNRYNDDPLPVTAVNSPPDTVTGSTDVPFGWKASSDPDLSDTPATLVYDIEAYAVGLDESDVWTFESSAGTTTLTGKLGDNQLWTYRIRSRDDEGAVSDWTEPREVLVNAVEDPPAGFELQYPPSGELIVELDSLTFRWEHSSDPDWESSIEYQFELYPEAGEKFSITLKKNEYTYLGLLVNEAAYRWCVIAVDNTGLETQSDSEFRFSTSTTPTAPAASTMPPELMPMDALAFTGATDPNPRDILTYTVEVASQQTFTEKTIAVEGLPHASGVMNSEIASFAGQEGLIDDQDYWFRVKATDNHGFEGAYSTPVKFRFNRENDAPTPPLAPFNPTSNMEVHDQKAVFSWTHGSDIDLSDPVEKLSYELRFDSDGELEESALYTFETRMGVSDFQVPVALNDNTPWVWQVRTRDDDGAVSEWSPVQSILINVAEDPPSSPVLLSPQNGITLNHLGPIDFKWSVSVDPDYQSSVTYRIEYSTTPQLDNMIRIDDLTDLTVSVAGPLQNTTYYWRCIAIDNTELGTVSTMSSFILDTRPTVPQPLAPISMIEVPGETVLRWSRASDPNLKDVIKYSIEVGVSDPSKPDGMNTIGRIGDLSDMTIALNKTGFDPAQVVSQYGDDITCRWRVRATDNHGIESAWSQPAEFILNYRNDSPDPVPALVTPKQNEQVKDVSLSWTAAEDPDHTDTPDRLSYQVEFNSSAGFDGQILTRNAPIGATSLQATGLTDNATWYWRVRTVDDNGAISEPSDIGKFVYNSKNDFPEAFSLLEPAANSSVELPQLKFKWKESYDVDPGSKVMYSLILAQDAGFSIGVKRFDGLDGSEFRLPDGTVDVEGVYFWKVAANDGLGGITWGSGSDTTPWSVTIKFPEPPEQPSGETTPGG